MAVRVPLKDHMRVPDLPATVQVQTLLPEKFPVLSGWRIDVSSLVYDPVTSP